MSKMITYGDPVDMTQLPILSDFTSGTFSHENATHFVVNSGGETYTFWGTGFTYDSNGDLTGGTINHIKVVDQDSGKDNYHISGLDLSVSQFETFAQSSDLSGFENAIFGGKDRFDIGDSNTHNSFVEVHLQGGDGNDTFDFGYDFNSFDTVDGGAGYNTVRAGGNLTLTPGALENVQKIILQPGLFVGPYTTTVLASDEGQSLDMSGGKPLTIDGHLFVAPEQLNIQVTDQTVPVNLIGGAGNDTLLGGTEGNHITGGLGQDQMGGGGRTVFVYNSAAESTGANFDILIYFNATLDRFEVPHAVTAMNSAITSGTLSTASFDTDMQAALNGHLDPYHAVLVSPDSGTLSGNTFIVVDQNGVAGYQSGSDLVMAIGHPTGSNPYDVTASDFITHR